jgi:hypothetical protein
LNGEQMPARQAHTASVAVSAQPIWRIRLWQELPRRLLHAAAAAGLIASIRFAVAPPRPIALARRPASAGSADLQAQGFASRFAHAYLSWRQNDPQARRTALEPFAGSALALEAGTQPPPNGSEQVLFEQVVAEREVQPHLRICTVAVQTATQGLLYLAVPVLQPPGGSLSLAGYPAFVGPPASAGAEPALEAGGEVQDASLRTVVTRALRNYLAPAPSNLAADLAPGANVSPPAQGLALEALQSLTWALGRNDAVVALLTAVGPGGARYTLAYEVAVRESAGRWEITAIQAETGG